MNSKEEVVACAKLAEQANRYDDMADLMLQTTELSNQMDFEERNLFSMAFKHSIGARRNSHRVISHLEQKLEGDDPKVPWVQQYGQKIEKELRGICTKVLDALENVLIPNAGDSAARVFYIKMKADYYRYLAEVISGDEREGIVKQCQGAYEQAFEIAKDELSVVDPIRLGLVLNFSVFFYEIAGAMDKACDLADKAFNDALAELRPTDDDHKDSSMILQLIRDNLTLWMDNDEMEQGGGDAAQDGEVATDEGDAGCDRGAE